MYRHPGRYDCRLEEIKENEHGEISLVTRLQLGPVSSTNSTHSKCFMDEKSVILIQKGSAKIVEDIEKPMCVRVMRGKRIERFKRNDIVQGKGFEFYIFYLFFN